MDINTFTNNYDDISVERRVSTLTDILRILVENDDLDARYVIDELLKSLQDLEAEDYFGTEGYRG